MTGKDLGPGDVVQRLPEAQKSLSSQTMNRSRHEQAVMLRAVGSFSPKGSVIRGNVAKVDRRFGRCGPAVLVAYFTLVSCVANSSAVKMEA
jgi:hypothetical protein